MCGAFFVCCYLVLHVEQRYVMCAIFMVWIVEWTKELWTRVVWSVCAPVLSFAVGSHKSWWSRCNGSRQRCNAKMGAAIIHPKCNESYAFGSDRCRQRVKFFIWRNLSLLANATAQLITQLNCWMWRAKLDKWRDKCDCQWFIILLNLVFGEFTRNERRQRRRQRRRRRRWVNYISEKCHNHWCLHRCETTGNTPYAIARNLCNCNERGTREWRGERERRSVRIKQQNPTLERNLFCVRLLTLFLFLRLHSIGNCYEYLFGDVIVDASQVLNLKVDSKP